MIRINRIHENTRVLLIVEGSLSGAWVDELEKCWRDAKRSAPEEQIRIELSGVNYIDENGRRLLKCMFSEGAELLATGVMTKGIIEEIVGDQESKKGLLV